MPIQLATLKKTIVGLLGESRQTEIAVNLIERLAYLPQQETSYISYTALSSMAKIKSTDPELLAAISTLTSDATRVLLPFFVYFDEKDREFPLTATEFSKAKADGYFVNPLTGDRDYLFSRHISPYFRTSDDFDIDDITP